MSLSRSLFDLYGVPTLLANFGETELDIIYEIGGDQTRLTGYQRAKRIEMRETDDGDVVRVTRMQVVFSTDPFSEWGGVANPQIKARYTITDLTRCETATFSVESHEGPAYEHISPSLVMVNLIQYEGMAKAASYYRE